jgi:hypothetical protein
VIAIVAYLAGVVITVAVAAYFKATRWEYMNIEAVLGAMFWPVGLPAMLLVVLFEVVHERVEQLKKDELLRQVELKVIEREVDRWLRESDK